MSKVTSYSKTNLTFFIIKFRILKKSDITTDKYYLVSATSINHCYSSLSVLISIFSNYLLWHRFHWVYKPYAYYAEIVHSECFVEIS